MPQNASGESRTMFNCIDTIRYSTLVQRILASLVSCCHRQYQHEVQASEHRLPFAIVSSCHCFRFENQPQMGS